MRELLTYKKKTRGVITNSGLYLEQIPRYVRARSPSRAGLECARFTSIQPGT